MSSDDICVLAAWTFGRRGQRLTIQREQHGDQEFVLLVLQDGQPRSFGFTDFERLVVFQADMEAFLLRTGWLLTAFAPERRRGPDRRGAPRYGNDRRRWWTDPQPE